MSSLRDSLIIARFEVLRAVRSWQAVALVALYVVAIVGGAYLFIEALAELEGALADTMGVARTRWPGPLTESLREGEQIGKMLDFLTGDEEVSKRLRGVPLLAIFVLWEGIGLAPFLAAMSASEAIAGDVRSRAIRFEVQRTGRSELVVGRFLGQLVLIGGATLVAILAVGGLGMALMGQQDPVRLFGSLFGFGLRVVLFSIPFVGVGVSLSAMTTSPAWARVMALALVAGSWILYGVCQIPTEGMQAVVADVITPLLPQSQAGSLWRSGMPGATGALVLLALGVGALAPGLWRFSVRDL